MPIIQPDLSDVFAPIEEGVYPARITEVTYSTSKKDNPMLVVRFEIDVRGETRVRRAYLVISGAGAFNFDQLLRACHFDDLADKYRDPSVSPKPPFDTDQLIGQELLVQIVPDVYNGQPTDRINGFLKK